MLAPFAPFVTDRIYQNMVEGSNAAASVHLTDLPEAEASNQLRDESLEHEFDVVRRAINLGRSLRAKHNLKTRQVLPSMMVITRNPDDRKAIEKGESYLLGELNLKAIEFSHEEAKMVNLSLKPNLKVLGKRLGKELGAFRKDLEALNQDPDAVAALVGALESQGQAEFAGRTMELSDFLIERGPKDERLIATEGGVTVLLDTTLTPELIAEGLAREVVNRVQNYRKDLGLLVTNRIKLAVEASADLAAAVTAHADYIKSETLADELVVNAGGIGEMSEFDFSDHKLAVGLEVTAES